MRVVVPCETNEGLASIRSGHFGHAPWLTVVDYDDEMNLLSVTAVRNADHDTAGCAGVIEHVMGLDADAIITAGMGMPPLMRFTQAGIVVYADRVTPGVQDVLVKFAAGDVARMSPDQACRH
ncbi:MAG: dinitrogenase iron-molybdenum cofactor biosynthesis protein [Atopobiaceae bacterium]|nr:dinitrogenase iron-molybdenum cofactor biosynthesis protein [Atopobiaceae bacterium]